jgi:hypothetical protein
MFHMRETSGRKKYGWRFYWFSFTIHTMTESVVTKQKCTEPVQDDYRTATVHQLQVLRSSYQLLRRKKEGSMAKVTLNPLIKQISGKMGDIVFRVSPTGEQTIMKLPDMSGVKWSEAQEAHRQRFKQAVEYARAAMAEPKVRRRYEKMAAKNQKRPYDMAVSDFFKGKDLLSKK